MKFKLVCSVLMALLLLSGPAISAKNVVRITPEEAQHSGILTLKPELTRREPLVRAPASVRIPPQDEYMVSALQPGVISQVNVAVGMPIRKGQVLATIHSPGLVALQRTVLDSATALQLADTKLQRDRMLLAEGIIANIRYQETKSNYDRLALAAREAEQMLSSAGLAPDEIRALKRSRRLQGELAVRSPVDGVVLERLAVVGQRVDLLAPLFRAGTLDVLWLEIDMPMERLGEIKLGDAVDIENPTLSATIIQVAQSVNPGSQSALVRAAIEGKTDRLKPGQHVNVQIMHASSDQLFRLPINAVFSQAGKDYVFVRVAEGFAARAVAVASREERNVLIHDGLQAGDEVVVQGVAALKASWVGIGGDQ